MYRTRDKWYNKWQINVKIECPDYYQIRRQQYTRFVNLDHLIEKYEKQENRKYEE